MGYDYVVLFAESYNLPKELKRCRSSGGHVWVVDPHELDTVEGQAFKSVEIGHPSALFGEVVVEYLGLCESAYRSIGGVAGIGHEHAVAGVQESERNVKYSLLGAYERLNLGVGV